MEKVSFLGKLEETVDLYDNVMDEAGKLGFYEKGFHIQHGSDSIKAPYSYITEMEKVGGTTLGRVMIRFVAFDMFGNRYNKKVALPEYSYLRLKKYWEQAEK